MRNRFAESVRVVGERYTPEPTPIPSINDIIDALSSGPAFLGELHSLATRASAASRQDSGMWGASAASASPLINDLDEICTASIGTSSRWRRRVAA